MELPIYVYIYRQMPNGRIIIILWLCITYLFFMDSFSFYILFLRESNGQWCTVFIGLVITYYSYQCLLMEPPE